MKMPPEQVRPIKIARTSSALSLSFVDVHALRVPFLLVLLAVLTVPGYRAIIADARNFSIDAAASFVPLLVVTLPYVAACWYILRSRAAPDRRWQWVELGVILAVGVALRAIFWPLPPTISQDAFRYVWDAHQVAHGVSPYLHTPTDPAVAWLRDKVIWPSVNWRDAPTIYPPGAQLMYLLVYKLAPLTIWAMKTAIALSDLAIAGLTIMLLRRAGMDPRRVILYWWSPIPIIEFAFSAHLDALAVLWTVAALLAAQSIRPRWRIAAGVFLAMATMTKLYPLLFVVVLVRRRDWRFLAALVGTVVVVALPFVKLGLGGGGFLGTYFHQRFVDQGFLLKEITLIWINLLGGNGNQLILLEMLTLAGIAGTVLWARWRYGVSPTAGMLALSAGWILLSPHLFPWYIAALLPLLAVELTNERTQRGEHEISRNVRNESSMPHQPSVFPVDFRALRVPSLSLPALALWLFAILMPFTYVIFAPGIDPDLFQIFFLVPFALVVWDVWRQRAWLGLGAEIRRSWSAGRAALTAFAVTREEK